ncbi:AI-2E family transporter [Natronomonas sp. CBA1123]|uniref:AI-2E family transporter n=1 Tax=Natronomonas sp. CBA1123 TaxID=2668070 RepID=UPI0012EA68D1|nr:AI-2E family transporter [Natronomonas sp. CBA1123]MUV87080.1 AI-2E family transporter [Natronomonas sp. CBA1123]
MVSESSRGRLGWWGVGFALAVVVAATFYVFVGTVVTALFLYYVSRPLYRHLRGHLRPTFAAAASLLCLSVPVVFLLAYTTAVALQELRTLAQTVDLGPVQSIVSPYFDVSALVEDPATLFQNPDVVDALLVVFDGIYDYLPFVVSVLLHLFVALALTFYLLRDGPKLARWVRDVFGDEAGVLDAYGTAVDRDLKSVYFGNILNAVIAAVIGTITYSLLNIVAPPALAVPYPALLGILVGVTSLVPVVGMKLVYVPVGGLLFGQALLRGDPLWFPVVFFVVSGILIDFIPDLLLRPYVSGRNLHVGLVMVAYILGPLLFGWYGLFLGPLLLVLVFHFARFVLPELLDGTPIQPIVVSPAALRQSHHSSPATAESVAAESEVTDSTGAESVEDSAEDDDIEGPQ